MRLFNLGSTNFLLVKWLSMGWADNSLKWVNFYPFYDPNRLSLGLSIYEWGKVSIWCCEWFLMNEIL